MAGGPWTAAQVGQGRPGLFINFVPAALAAIAPGQQGVVASIVKAPWGPDKTIQYVNNETDLLNYYTSSDTAPYNAWYEGHHAFLGGARQLKFYRIEGAGAAKPTHIFVDTTGSPVNAFNVVGKYNGVYGNSFKVAGQANGVDSTKTDVLLYNGTTLIATYTTKTNARGVAGHIQEIVNLINADAGNYLVTAVFLAEGNSTPATVAAPGTALTGGNDGVAPVMADYTAAMAAIELEQFNVFHVDAVTSDIAGLPASINSWVKGMRGYGKYVRWVTGSDTGESLATATTNAAAFNNEYTHYVYPGVYELNSLGNRTLYRGSAYAATLAGAIASLIPGDSLTYWPLPNLLDLEVRLSNNSIVSGLAAGLLLNTFDGQQFKIEEDINTLTTLGKNQSGVWQNIDAINTMDAIATALTVSANANYVGKVPNDVIGQNALINAVRDFLRSMASQRAITPTFTVGLDPVNKSVGKTVFLVLSVQIVQSMKFLYFTVTIS